MTIVKYYTKIFLKNVHRTRYQRLIDSYWFKSVLLELFILQPVYSFFIKMLKSTKTFCHIKIKKPEVHFIIKNIFDILMIKWALSLFNFDGDLFCMNKPYFCEIYFPQIDVICIVKIQQKYVRSIEMHFYGFFQTENKLPKNLITLPTFSGNKFAVILRAEIFKISIICVGKIGSTII